MPKNILIDINVLLEIFLERPGYLSSRKLIETGGSVKSGLYISAHAVTTMAYLLERASVPTTLILKHINWLLNTFKIAATDSQVLKSAATSHIKDYEDAVMEQAALACSAVAIITRNVRDFRASRVKAFTPEAYLKS